MEDLYSAMVATFQADAEYAKLALEVLAEVRGDPDWKKTFQDRTEKASNRARKARELVTYLICEPFIWDDNE